MGWGKLPDVGERLGRLEERMNRVEQGVSNFREFQADARDFFSRADERAKNEAVHRNRRDEEIKSTLAASDRKMNRRLGFAGLVVAILALLVGWLTYRDSQRKVGENTAPVVQSSQQNQQQDAGGPTGTR
jgi:hypothetical protein